MKEFFYGWRRKAGVAALVAAIVLICGWVRSHVVTEQVWMEDSESTELDLRLGSSGGSIYWIRETVWWKPSRHHDGWN